MDAGDAVYPSDPLGLLESVPELESFLSDRRVRGAIERGRPHDVYRALFWAWVLRRFREHRETLSMLLSRRRLFVGPMNGAPSMFTYNGIGLKFYGEAERAANGAYIGTHYLVFAFIPLFPLGSYLMGSAGANSFRFFGRAPFGLFHWLWNRLLVLGVLLGVLLGLGRAVASSRYAEVTVVNGFSAPIEAELCGTSLTLAPHSHTSVYVDVGSCSATARTSRGTPIETVELDVRPGWDLIGWNVAGAAPIISGEVLYAAVATEPPPPTFYCGQSRLILDDLDYLFVEPPASVSLARGRTSRRHYLDVAEGEPIECFYYLLEREELAAAINLARAMIAASDADPEQVRMLAASLAALEQPSTAMELLLEGLAADPDDLGLHRTYQDLMVRSGRRRELLPTYRERAAREDSGNAHYLAGRIDPAIGVRDWEALHERFSENPRIVSALAYARCRTGDFRGGTAAFEDAVLGEDEESVAADETRVRCLIGAGRGTEVLEQLREVFERETSDVERVHLASLSSELWMHLSLTGPVDGPPDGAPLVTLLSAEARSSYDAYYRARSRQPVREAELGAIESPMTRALTEVMMRATTDPRGASQALTTLSPGGVSWLPNQLETLLLAENLRAPGPATERLLELCSFDPDAVRAVREFLQSGVEDGLSPRLGAEDRAALYFVRSRLTTLSDQERAAALDRAHQLDTLPTWIASAETDWPVP